MFDSSYSSALLPVFLCIAALYSSVGHGGASGYLAVFTLTGLARPDVAPVALLLNIVVAGTSFINYYREGYFSGRLLLPFVVFSVPSSFLGGMISPTEKFFSILLGTALLCASFRLFIKIPEYITVKKNSAKSLWSIGSIAGSGLGFVSGIIGIGGGIFLSPVLLLLKMGNAKQVAAIASAFIVLNSISGLIGHSLRGFVFGFDIFPLIMVVAAGGYFGSKLGSEKLSVLSLNRMLAAILLFASLKLLI
jgi:uncharacterized protein